jgi:hypothetical protein
MPPVPTLRSCLAWQCAVPGIHAIRARGDGGAPSYGANRDDLVGCIAGSLVSGDLSTPDLRQDLLRLPDGRLGVESGAAGIKKSRRDH